MRLRNLEGLLNRVMYLVFTFLCATNQAKTLTFEWAFNFHKNLARKNGIGFNRLDRAKDFFLWRINLKRIKTKFLNLQHKKTT